jgi:CHAT domain-containing protein
VAQIAARRSPNAFLAYLSACSTSRGNLSLADESIHISSAFQIVGYRHVIASLWPVADTTACAVADLVYAAPVWADPASALRAAVRSLRDSDPGDVVNWSAFIHTGP